MWVLLGLLSANLPLPLHPWGRLLHALGNLPETLDETCTHVERDRQAEPGICAPPFSMYRNDFSFFSWLTQCEPHWPIHFVFVKVGFLSTSCRVASRVSRIEF